jgi:hypothetical protein
MTLLNCKKTTSDSASIAVRGEVEIYLVGDDEPDNLLLKLKLLPLNPGNAASALQTVQRDCNVYLLMRRHWSLSPPEGLTKLSVARTEVARVRSAAETTEKRIMKKI